MANIEKGSVPLYIALLTEDKNGEFTEPHPSTGYRRAKLTKYEIRENDLNVIMEDLYFGVAKEGGYGPVTHFGVYIEANHEYPLCTGAINGVGSVGLYVPERSEAMMQPEELYFRLPPIKFTKIKAEVRTSSDELFRFR